MPTYRKLQIKEAGGLVTVGDPRIPSQTGNAGKVITTDGTNLSFAQVSGGTAATTPPASPTAGAVWLDTDGSTAEASLVDLTSAQTLTNKTLTAPVTTLAINFQYGTSYTMVLSDASKLLWLENWSSPFTLTIPAVSSVAFPTGTVIYLSQGGSGQVTVTGASGVIIYSTPGVKLRANKSGATLVKVASDSWWLIGDLTA